MATMDDTDQRFAQALAELDAEQAARRAARRAGAAPAPAQGGAAPQQTGAPVPDQGFHERLASFQKSSRDNLPDDVKKELAEVSRLRKLVHDAAPKEDDINYVATAGGMSEVVRDAIVEKSQRKRERGAAVSQAGKYVAPAWRLDGFHCPHCSAYAEQNWEEVYVAGQPRPIRGCLLAFCAYCNDRSIWVEERQVWPITLTGPLPNEDLGEGIVDLYNEARSVASQSPRSAAALLRLCTEMLVKRLCKESNVPWINLNDGIGQLAQRGLPQQIQQALDTLRVIGNAAVHPGQVDLTDDLETVEGLFEFLNLIANDCITQPRTVDRAYANKVPVEKRQAIEKRDGKTREAQRGGCLPPRRTLAPATGRRGTARRRGKTRSYRPGFLGISPARRRCGRGFRRRPGLEDRSALAPLGGAGTPRP